MKSLKIKGFLPESAVWSQIHALEEVIATLKQLGNEQGGSKGDVRVYARVEEAIEETIRSREREVSALLQFALKEAAID